MPEPERTSPFRPHDAPNRPSGRGTRDCSPHCPSVDDGCGLRGQAPESAPTTAPDHRVEDAGLSEPAPSAGPHAVPTPRGGRPHGVDGRRPRPADLDQAVEVLLAEKLKSIPWADSGVMLRALTVVAHRELDAVGYGRLIQERDDALRRAEDLRRQLLAVGEAPRGR